MPLSGSTISEAIRDIPVLVVFFCVPWINKTVVGKSASGEFAKASIDFEGLLQHIDEKAEFEIMRRLGKITSNRREAMRFTKMRLAAALATDDGLPTPKSKLSSMTV